jgi:hypothetical protein
MGDSSTSTVRHRGVFGTAKFQVRIRELVEKLPDLALA